MKVKLCDIGEFKDEDIVMRRVKGMNRRNIRVVQSLCTHKHTHTHTQREREREREREKEHIQTNNKLTETDKRIYRQINTATQQSNLICVFLSVTGVTPFETLLVIRKSVFGWRTFPNLCLIYG